MKIKICGLTEEQNLLDVLTLSPDYIGVNFYPGSSRFAGDNNALPFLMHAITGICKKQAFL